LDSRIYHNVYYESEKRVYSLGLQTGECRAFIVDGQQVGLVRPDVMKEILNYPQVSLCVYDIIYIHMYIRY